MRSDFFSGSLVKSNRNIYTASAFAKNALLYLQETGVLSAIKSHTSHRKNLDSYLFFIVLSGSGTLTYCGNEYNLKKNDCVFIDCNKEYSHSSSTDLWTLKWVHFFGNNIKDIYSEYIQRGGLPCFALLEVLKYEELLNDIYDISYSDDKIRDIKINQAITTLITFLMEENWTSQNGIKQQDGKRGIKDIKGYLHSNYTQEISLDYLSARFYINKFYLSRIFKEQTGVSITNYLLEIRITKAKHKLRFTSLRVEEIAYSCGFNDANYFSRVFKKYEGISPIKYRNLW